MNQIKQADSTANSGKWLATVSVVIPCYNRASLISRAVSSVQRQYYEAVEILLVDDGSTDNTDMVVADLASRDPRIRYLSHERNSGEAAARNTGVKAARGEFVAFLDSDDEWLPGKLCTQVAALAGASLSVAGVASRHLLVDDKGVETVVRDWTEDNPITSRNLLAKGCGLSMGNTLMARRSVFADIGYFDESLPLFVDLDWLCRLTSRYGVLMLPDVAAKYYKAPMRRGEFVARSVDKFKKKNADMLRSYSMTDRLRIESRFYNYVSLAYAANGPWWKFVATRCLHFLFNPFQNVGNYFHFMLALIGAATIGKRD